MQQYPSSLEKVKSHFDQWRVTRTKREKIPANLWDKVKLLIGRHSTDAKTAKERAETIRNDASLMKCIYEGKALANITISIGISVYPGDGESGELFITTCNGAQGNRGGRRTFNLKAGLQPGFHE